MTRKEKRRAAQIYLERIRKLDTKIRIKEESLEEVKSSLGYKARGYLERVQTSISLDGVCDAVIELLELEAEIGRCRTEYYRQKEKIVTELFSMEKRVYIDVLSYRYLKYMDFEYIGEALKYSQRHITRLHGEALVSFYDMVLSKKEEKDEKKDGD